MRAITQTERVKQNRIRERANREQFQSKADTTPTNNPGTYHIQHNPIVQSGSYIKSLGAKLEGSVEQMNTSQEQGADKVQLMLIATELQNEQVEGQSKG